MRVLVADTFEPSGLDGLRQTGCDVLYDHLRAWKLNVQESENVIFEGAEAAVARINLDAVPPPDLLDAVKRGNEDILSLHVVEIGLRLPASGFGRRER